MKSVDRTIRVLCSAVRRQWRSFRIHLCLSLIAIFLLVQFACAELAAQYSAPTVYQVEAAYLYNFGKFVKWPAAYTANQGAAFPICVLGDDRFGNTLQSTVAGKSLDGLPVSVRHIEKPQDAASCRVLFINDDQESHLKGILAALDKDSVLTVSNISDFSKRGGMIEFVMQGDRVRFAINRTSAEDARLTLESDLLKVAMAVRETGHTGGL